MKKLTLCFMTVLMVLAFAPSHLQAATVTGESSVTVSGTVESADANVLIARLELIKAMDLSNLNAIEKRALRKEVRSIKATLNQMEGGYIYISAVGLILIVVLLIILL